MLRCTYLPYLSSLTLKNSLQITYRSKARMMLNSMSSVVTDSDLTMGMIRAYIRAFFCAVFSCDWGFPNALCPIKSGIISSEFVQSKKHNMPEVACSTTFGNRNLGGTSRQSHSLLK